MGGSNTGSSVLDRLVRNGEFSKIMTNHLWLDLNLCEHLSVVNSNNGSSHLRNNNHVSQVSLDNIWLLVDRAFLLLLAELLDQSHGLALETPVELAPDSAGEELHETFIVHVKELVEINSTVGVLTEGPFLLQLCGFSVTHDCYNLSLVEVNQANISL